MKRLDMDLDLDEYVAIYVFESVFCEMYLSFWPKCVTK